MSVRNNITSYSTISISIYIYPKHLKCSCVFGNGNCLKIASTQGQQFCGLTIKAHGKRRKQCRLFVHTNPSNLTATWINIGIWWIVICSSLWLSLITGFKFSRKTLMYNNVYIIYQYERWYMMIIRALRRASFMFIIVAITICFFKLDESGFWYTT